MSRALHDQISRNMQAPDAAVSARWSKLRADIDHFVGGGYVNSNLLKPLSPARHGVWTLRSVRPRPGLRVFGRFAAPDVFVATHVQERKLLEGKGSQEWEFAKLECEEEWRRLFGDRRPFIGERYTDYITDNAARDVEIDP